MSVFGDEELARLHEQVNNIDETIDDESVEITVTVTVTITTTRSNQVIVVESRPNQVIITCHNTL